MRWTLVVLMAVCCGGIGAQANWTEPHEPFAIADNLYYVGSAGLAAYLITSTQGHVLIDAPLQANVPMVLGNIRQLGFDPRDIRMHVASHAHFDHVGGMADMVAATGGDLLLSEADAALVARGADFGFDSEGYPPARATRLVRHLESVSVGDVTLIAHVTPGHTAGCTSWSGTVRIDGEPVEFVSVCSLSVLPDYRLVGQDPTYAGQGADYCRSVAHLRSLEPAIFLAPHPGFFDMLAKLRTLRSGDPRAFVDPQGYDEYLDEAEERIERALAEQGHTGGCDALLDSR